MNDTHIAQLKKNKPFKGVFSSFTKKYNLSKTLRFELKPLPETRKFLSEFIESDTQRSKDYQELKGIVDEYHKYYIELALSEDSTLNDADIQQLDKLCHDVKKPALHERQEKIKKDIVELQNKLRKQIAKNFKDQKTLFGKDLLKKILPEWLKNTYTGDNKEHKQDIVKKFKDFSTYLKGFYENRKNIYSEKEQSTAISYRIINENFPKFSFNRSVYKTVKESPSLKDFKEKLNSIKSDFKEELEYFSIINIEEIFHISFFNKCLNQKGIDYYNTVIGGKSLKDRRIQGLNEVINRYRQDNQINKHKLPNLQLLYKQILSDRESHSFLTPFEDNKSLMQVIDAFWKQISISRTWDNSNQKASLLTGIKILFLELFEKQNNLDKIYFERGQLSYLSQELFEDWRFIQTALEYYAEHRLQGDGDFEGKENLLEGTQKRKGRHITDKAKKSFLKKDFFSFQEVHSALVLYQETPEGKAVKPAINPEKNILLHYFQSAFDTKSLQGIEESKPENFLAYFKTVRKEKKLPDINKLTTFYDLLVSQISKTVLEEKQFPKDGQQIELIKVFLDSVQDFLQFIRPVRLEKNGKKAGDLELDHSFYDWFDELYEELKPIISLYNKCRNFIATNKNHLKKIKINFEDSTLLNGWDVNKETDNLTIIFRRKENAKWIYYLGVMNKNHRKNFDYQLNFSDYKNKKSVSRKNELRDQLLVQGEEEGYYEKINYKFLPDPSKMFPKVFFSKKRLFYFAPSKEIQEINKNKTFVKNDGDKFNLEDCHKMIGFYKKSINIHYDWKNFNFKFSPATQYKDISDFYHEVSSQGYKLSFDKIKASYIEEKVKSGELYLFQIYNKDFSKYSKGNPNLHTSYFRLLFEQENLKDTVFKMNGEAEIFHRKASLERKNTHAKNQPIKNKNDLNPKKNSTFPYDLIKDRRFTEDKFFFHLPITLNFKARGTTPFKFNQDVLRFLKGNKNINIIGIDRGERHLAYYTVINQEGRILKQGSFNCVSNTYKSKKGPVQMKTDYHNLLDKKERDRDESRKSWTAIENIKNLKQGYLSHLVHHLSRLMIDYNAVVVLEDLNCGFKRGRMKFEKQVYQKLEKALIDKLNYLVFKDVKNLKEPGRYLNAYQLTAPFETFNKLGNQTGFIFYTPAYYTSKVCPLTGFVNKIYPKYESVEKSQAFFRKLETIHFNSEKDYFVFEYKDDKVNSSKKSDSSSLWKVCTHGRDRYKYNRKDKSHEKTDVTQKIKSLFDKHNISYRKGGNVMEDVVQQDQKEFFFHLISLLKLTVQLRHNNPEAKEDNKKDFILSPVSDETGRFFDSREAREDEPKNADSNGAYHIALKGLKSLQDLSENQGKIKIHPIKNKEWFDFIKNRKTTQTRKVG